VRAEAPNSPYTYEKEGVAAARERLGHGRERQRRSPCGRPTASRARQRRWRWGFSRAYGRWQVLGGLSIA
jgi:hypothetical protein